MYVFALVGLSVLSLIFGFMFGTYFALYMLLGEEGATSLIKEAWSACISQLKRNKKDE